MPEPIVTIPSNQPLIGIPFEENGKEITRYFSEKALTGPGEKTIEPETILQLAGSWGDLSWRELEKALNDIRHQSTPTAPLDTL